MEALYIEVGKCPRKVEIDGSLKSMQKLVGGFIECAYYFPDVVLVCNEEGMILRQPTIFLHPISASLLPFTMLTIIHISIC